MTQRSKVMLLLPPFRYPYSISSWALQEVRLPNGLVLPKDSIVNECTAIGFTNKGQEVWSSELQTLRIECIGIPPYPGQTYPRVIGIIRPSKKILEQVSRPLLVKGDATRIYCLASFYRPTALESGGPMIHLYTA
jgi:hypothetical protein